MTVRATHVVRYKTTPKQGVLKGMKLDSSCTFPSKASAQRYVRDMKKASGKTSHYTDFRIEKIVENPRWDAEFALERLASEEVA